MNHPHEQILRVMLRREKEWYSAPDFAALIGYEVSARYSELCKRYPEMFEARQKPGAEKYKERRIKFEEMEIWWDTLPLHYKTLFAAYAKGVANTVYHGVEADVEKIKSTGWNAALATVEEKVNDLRKRYPQGYDNRTNLMAAITEHTFAQTLVLINELRKTEKPPSTGGSSEK